MPPRPPTPQYDRRPPPHPLRLSLLPAHIRLHAHARTHRDTCTPQISYVTRLITPDDYNAAVTSSPSSCPLVQAGDLRSGRQVCHWAVAAPLLKL
jgi:hypothetical protein